MFSSSVRRVLSTVPASPTAVAFTTSAPRVAASQYHPQRRYSSSKPSSPANGAKGVPVGQPAPTQPSRSSRRKAKEATDDYAVKAVDKTMRHLPSVPSTMHLLSQEVTASDFFSLHRPISVTKGQIWPTAISNEMFSSIFAEPSRETKTAAVIGTLSNTIDGLNVAVKEQIPFDSDLQSGFSHENHNSDETRHLDQPLTFSIPFPQHILNSQFMPFNPPPPPIPMDYTETESTEIEAADETSKAAHSKTYHALITLEESKGENGEVQYTSYASDFVQAKESSQPPSFMERMRMRQKRYEDSMDQRWKDNRMWAISVKRQRKLKMKKHKYKKLMRKTRNLRRRLDRT